MMHPPPPKKSRDPPKVPNYAQYMFLGCFGFVAANVEVPSIAERSHQH